MFKIKIRQCEDLKGHGHHIWYDNDWVLSKKYECLGVLRSYFESCEKHMYRFMHYDEKKRVMIFRCVVCPNRMYPAEVRVDRWKYREMLLNQPEVDQIWPQ